MAKYKTDKPCLNCGKQTSGGNCFHHIKTRGSGGTDDVWNLMPLCFFCHERVHKIGLLKFSENFAVKLFLENLGWEICPSKGVWTHTSKTEVL